MLKTPLRLLLAASIALPGTLAISAPAKAGGSYGSHHYYGGYSGYGHHRGYGRHHYGGYRHHGGYYYGGHRRHHGHGHAGKYLGVALLGLGLGYVISRSGDRDERYYRDERYRGDYYRNDNNYRGGYASPPPPGYSGQDKAQDQPYSAQSFDFSQCEETREYQTTIFIDGEEQQAFGTACLMPDGAWVAGPMQIEP